MILGQLNCLLFLKFFRSSASFLESIRSPFLGCLSQSVYAGCVDFLNALVEAGQKPLFSPIIILSSRLGKTMTFNDVTGSMISQNHGYRYQEEVTCFDTSSLSLQEARCEVTTTLDYCYAKDLFKGGFDQASLLSIIRRPITN